MKTFVMILALFSLNCSKQEKTSNQTTDSVRNTVGSKDTSSQTTQTTTSTKNDSVQIPKQTDEEIVKEATNGLCTKLSGSFTEDGISTDYEAEVKDLNNDGQKEVLLHMAGSNYPKGAYALYIKQGAKWFKNFECLGSCEIASTTTNGYLDINLNAAVGNDKSLARWNGKMYVDKRGKKPCDF